MKAPVLVLSLVAAAAAGFVGGMMFQTPKDATEAKNLAAPVTPAKPAGRFHATTRFRVVKPHRDVFGEEKPKPERDSVWLQTQIEILRSREILLRVVRAERLDEKWKMLFADRAAEKLAGMLAIELEPGTDIVSVTAYGDNLTDIANFANSVRTAYEECCIGQHEDAIRRLGQSAEAMIKRQEAEVGKARLKLEEIADESQPGFTAAKQEYGSAVSLLGSLREQLMRQKVDVLVTRKPVELLQLATPPLP
jgi:hypothetical protein